MTRTYTRVQAASPSNGAEKTRCPYLVHEVCPVPLTQDKTLLQMDQRSQHKTLNTEISRKKHRQDLQSKTLIYYYFFIIFFSVFISVPPGLQYMVKNHSI